MRPLLAFIGFVGAVTLPFWVPLICAVALSVRWRAWEVALLGLFMDFLWMPSASIRFLPLCTIIALVALWSLEPLRRELLAR